MFDLNFCSHYIVEYILSAYFCLGNKNENGSSLLQQLVLRNTVYVCGKYVYGSSWMCGPTAIPLDKSQVRLMFLLAFSYAFGYLTLAINSSCKNDVNYVVVSLK